MYSYDTITAHKKQSQQLAYLYYLMGIAKDDESLIMRSRRVSQCSIMWGGLVCHSCGKLHNMHTFGCKDRFCPQCSSRRSRVTALQAVDILKDIVRDNRKLVLVTLTVKNVPAEGLNRAIQGFVKAWRGLREYRFMRRHLVAWGRNIEITKNFQRNTYHPHMHVLAVVDSDELLQVGAWQQAWKKAANLDYNPISDVREVVTQKGIFEVSKYVSKIVEYLDLPLGDAFDIISDISPAVYNRRLRSYGGEWAQLRRRKAMRDAEDMPEKEITEAIGRLDDAVCACGAPFLVTVFSWAGNRYMDVTGQVSAQNRFLVHALDAADSAASAARSRGALPLAQPLTEAGEPAR